VNAAAGRGRGRTEIDVLPRRPVGRNGYDRPGIKLKEIPPAAVAVFSSGIMAWAAKPEKSARVRTLRNFVSTRLLTDRKPLMAKRPIKNGSLGKWRGARISEKSFS
jgi:hypothetical protein